MANPKRIARRPWSAGETYPEIHVVLSDGRTFSTHTVTLKLEQPDGTIVTRTGASVSGAEGKFTWTATDLVAGYGQRAQITVNDGASRIEKTPVFLIDVDPGVA